METATKSLVLATESDEKALQFIAEHLASIRKDETYCQITWGNETTLLICIRPMGGK